MTELTETIKIVSRNGARGEVKYRFIRRQWFATYEKGGEEISSAANLTFLMDYLWNEGWEID
jgi:hypothetical protein